MLLKGLSLNKIKTIVSDFYLNHINNSLIKQRLSMTFLVHKWLEYLFPLLIAHAGSLFTALFVVI